MNQIAYFQVMHLPIRSYLEDFSHLFFPHICEGCGSDILEQQELICQKCLQQLPATGFFFHPDNPVENKFKGHIPIIAGGSGFYFTKNSLLQKLIASLKYFGNKEIGFYLGTLIGKELLQSNRFNTIDVLLPLPLNPRKEKKRGYNQAAEIAFGIAAVFKKPVLEKGLQRIIFTETQTHKNRISRWQNMQGVFATSGNHSLEGKHILLIDDIITTGATLETCGEQILKIQDTRLSIATVGYTI